MCGRYDLNAIAVELAKRFEVSLPASSSDAGSPDVQGVERLTAGAVARAVAKVEWHPRYNMAPGQHNPVVVRDGQGSNQLELMQWGLVPSWSQEVKVGYSTINARAETVASKPTFRKALRTQRCLVPATGYYEWVQATQSEQDAQGGHTVQSSQGKQPFRIMLRPESESNAIARIDGTRGADVADRIFAFAGLFDIWHGPDGQELQTYAIVTTRANDALASIHSRMPVILPSDAEGAWLDQDNTNIEELMSLLQPYADGEMAAYPVSRLVNSPSNDGRALIEPLSLLAA